MKLFDKTFGKQGNQELPLVPLKDLVVFPHMVVPFFAGRKGSIQAVEEAMAKDRKIFLSCQKNSEKEPTENDIYQTGTIAQILQMMKLPDGTIRVLVEGRERATITGFSSKKTPYYAHIRTIQGSDHIDSDISAMMRTVQESFKQYQQLNKKIPPEIVSSVERAEKPDKLIDLISANIPFNIQKKIELLSEENTTQRLEELAVSIESEIEMLSLRGKISNRVRKRMEKSQREYFLNEQVKEINKELGKDNNDPTGSKELEERIQKKDLPEAVLTKAQREIKRLGKLQPMSPEAGILRTYLEWIADLPWKEKKNDNTDIEAASRILEEDHYDMKEPKERILDFIAVSQLKGKLKGPILCFVGPPGTGKTSLGRSLARCLGRDFVRISLGGVRDEAEIRGHRKTYVGALPGKIIQSMRKAGSINPVFLLDEVDKISSDYRGDPASALLEVLDPEQNSTFTDHYLEVPYDLSNVIFITTANTLHNIPFPLRDRMEVINIPGYTAFEKQKIAEGFLIPKQLTENGLEWADIKFTPESIREIIQNYTMESGVRNLEREIATVARKIARDAVKNGFAKDILNLHEEKQSNTELKEIIVVKPISNSGENSPYPLNTEEITTAQEENPEEIKDSQIRKRDGLATGSEAGLRDQEPAFEVYPNENGSLVKKKDVKTDSQNKKEEKKEDLPSKPHFSFTVRPKDIRNYLGKTKYQKDLLYNETRPGLAYGLAWTELGGTMLPVEAVVFEGRGELILTGHLGDVMKESAHTAFSFLKSNSPKFKLPRNFYNGKDIHIHVPEGAIPKDGPSAGITLTAALLSALSGMSIHHGFAMTGEITLTGRLLPVGGIKEKVLAAHRHKFNTVILPAENKKDEKDLPQEVRSSMKFVFQDSILDALKVLFSEDLFQIRPF